MVTEADISILRRLRSDERNLTEIARTLSLPTSTVHDKVRATRRKGIITRHIPLLDWGKLGYNTTAFLTLRAAKGKREALQQYLHSHPNLNALYRVNYDHDFVAEVVFENPMQMHAFIDGLDGYCASQPGVFNVIQEIAKERFLTRETHDHRTDSV